MNQTFSFSRWLLLMRRHWMENGTLYIYGILSIIGAMGISMFFWVQSTHYYRQADLLIMYMIGLHIVGAIFASGAFNMLQKKDKGIYYMSLPASHFEKLLTMIVYNAILFTVIFSLCYYAVESLTILIVKAKVAAHPDLYDYRPIDFGQHNWLKNGIMYFGMLFFGVQALFLLGSVYFKRFSFLLTLVFLIIFIFLEIFYVTKLEHSIFTDQLHYWNSGGVHAIGEHDKIFRLPEPLRWILKWVCLVGWAPLFWWAAWFRLKEKEI